MTVCNRHVNVVCPQVVLLFYEHEFVELACQCPAVIVCRCSPTQKADIVHLLKAHTGRQTCAIGASHTNCRVVAGVVVITGMIECAARILDSVGEALMMYTARDLGSVCEHVDEWDWACVLVCALIGVWLWFLWLPPGDGGNDVSMIQAADAGVGIVGKVRPIPLIARFLPSPLSPVFSLISDIRWQAGWRNVIFTVSSFRIVIFGCFSAAP